MSRPGSWRAAKRHASRSSGWRMSSARRCPISPSPAKPPMPVSGQTIKVRGPKDKEKEKPKPVASVFSPRQYYDAGGDDCRADQAHGGFRVHDGADDDTTDVVSEARGRPPPGRSDQGPTGCLGCHSFRYSATAEGHASQRTETPNESPRCGVKAAGSGKDATQANRPQRFQLPNWSSSGACRASHPTL